MSELEPNKKVPQDLVAIFHGSFHPTKGNTIDWSLKASDDLPLDRLEFSVLPSGLHLVEQDVVYFTKDDQHGVCVFRRRTTTEAGHRGFRLSSLGILLAKSRRPRPWRHLKALKLLTEAIYSKLENAESLEPTEDDWEPARRFFEERKLQRSDLGGAGDWTGWSQELDGPFSYPIGSNPTLHLPHLLRILGPSSLTLYKHILGRKRILIYTLPPVEVACILCRVAADICFDSQSNSDGPASRLNGKHKEPISVLGMITLADIDRLEIENRSGRGWIACTTDALFMERPSHYDLLIDLTTSTPNKATRPTFYSSKPVISQPGSSRGPSHRLSTIRFAWSDVKLWNELERILHLDSDHAHVSCCGPLPPDALLKSKTITAWTDVWQVYEDVCIICAGLWIGSWRGNSRMSYSSANGPENWGSVRLEGDDDLSLGSAYVRNLGMGIEGRPSSSSAMSSLGVGTAGSSSRSTRRASAMSWSSSKGTTVGTIASTNGKAKQASTTSAQEPTTPTIEEPLREIDSDSILAETQQRLEGPLMTTFAILQTFHAHTSFQLSMLEDILVRQGISSSSISASGERTIVMTPKDILSFELGPLSGFDAKYLEWFAEEYAGDNVKVVLKRGWKDLLGVIFGYS